MLAHALEPDEALSILELRGLGKELWRGIDALIAIRDTGIGIRPEDEELIFEPFRQARAPVATKQEGTGLGLPLVRELVGLHGGRVWLDSAPGAGSCFSFTLPHVLDRLQEKVAAGAPQVLAITR